jgi:hypothetical protein
MLDADVRQRSRAACTRPRHAARLRQVQHSVAVRRHMRKRGRCTRHASAEQRGTGTLAKLAGVRLYYAQWHPSNRKRVTERAGARCAARTRHSDVSCRWVRPLRPTRAACTSAIVVAAAGRHALADNIARARRREAEQRLCGRARCLRGVHRRNEACHAPRVGSTQAGPACAAAMLVFRRLVPWARCLAAAWLPAASCACESRDGQMVVLEHHLDARAARPLSGQDAPSAARCGSGGDAAHLKRCHRLQPVALL